MLPTRVAVDENIGKNGFLFGLQESAQCNGAFLVDFWKRTHGTFEN